MTHPPDDRALIAEAELADALTVLAAFLACHAKQGGSPREQKAYNAALAVLIKHDRDPGAAARKHAEAAYAAWRAARDGGL